MASSERVYKDFVPPHKMEREPATHTLTVNLSAQGYKKEHIRVQMVHSHRRLIVRGERPVDADGNRWSRFRLELGVPDGCDAKAIHARFDGGVVRVTMPGIPPDLITVVAATGQQQQQEPTPLPSSPPKHARTAAAAAGDDDAQGRKGVVGAAEPDGAGDRAARGREDKHETPRKQEARQRVVSSAKDAGGSSSGGDDIGGIGEMTAASPSARQGYGFLHNRKMATTVLGVVLALISLGIYVRYSIWQ